MVVRCMKRSVPTVLSVSYWPEAWLPSSSAESLAESLAETSLAPGASPSSS